jgi:hypothetical protein
MRSPLRAQFAVSDGAVVLWIVTFPDDCRLIPAFGEMPVKAIRRCVQGTISVPFDVQIIGIIRYIADLGVGFDPVYTLALLSPELVRVINRGGIKHLVGFGVNMRGFRQICIWLKD